METAIVPAPDEKFQKIASPWHTVLILFLQAGLVIRGLLRAGQLRAMENPDRILIYRKTIVVQWFVFALVLAGLWLRGSSIYSVLGERWRSLRQFFADLGIGLIFLIGSILLTSLLTSHAQESATNQATQFLLPQTGLEIAWWVVLSLTAGICEETLYRGYLQRQFTSFTKSVPFGIVLSGVLFGAAHSYQGLRQATVIASMGALGGTVAYWRKSTRPGMVAHTLQDLLGGLMRHG
jgi:membrane protease YdiL (CAAX protease family)